MKRSRAACARGHEAEEDAGRERRAPRRRRGPGRPRRLRRSAACRRARCSSAPTRPTCRGSRRAPPPTSASSTLSVSNCRMMRIRSAPSARRTAISRAASRRARQQQVGDVDARDEQHEADRALQHEQRRLHAADALLVQRHRVDALAGVRFRDAPAASRFASAVEPRPRLLDATRRRAAGRTCGRPPSCATGWPDSAAAAATSRRRDAATGVKPAGMTPMISWLSPLIGIDRPIDRASPPKRRVHSAWLRTTTRGAFGMSSDWRNARPSAGATPSTSKYSCVTCSPSNDSGIRRRRRRSRSSRGCCVRLRRRRSAPSSRSAATAPSTPSPARRARAGPATRSPAGRHRDRAAAAAAAR